MATQPTGDAAPSLGGLLNNAWDFLTGTFKGWVDDEIGGAELALEQQTQNELAEQNAANAPATNGVATALGAVPVWLIVAVAGVGLFLALRD